VQSSVTLGYSGAASFTQSSGTHSIGGSLFMGVLAGSSGAYSLSGGTLSATQILVGAGTNTGSGGIGAFTQTGGTVSAASLVLAGGSNAFGTYTLSGADSSLLVNREAVGARGNGVFIQTAGTHIVSTNGVANGALTIGNSAAHNGTVTLSGGLLSAGDIYNYGTLSVLGGTLSARINNFGTVVLASGIDAKTLNVNNYNVGVIKLAPAGTTSVSVQSLAMTAGATVDLAAAGFLLNYGAGPNPLASVKSWVASGRAGGAWNGTGITSSLAASDPIHQSIGLADGAANVVTGLSAGQFLVHTAPLGDVNLDGKTDASDVTQILSRGHFNAAPTTNGWIDGDQNGDGVVNNVDVRTIALSGNYGAASAAASPSAITVPASAGLPAYTYDPTTGDVTFVSNGVSNIVDLHLRSAASRFLPASSTFTSFATKTTGELESTLFGSTFDNGLDLGNILPTGLTLPALQSDLTLLYGVSGAGVEQSATIAVPEPSMAAITSAALSGVVAILRRRRRGKRP
jgi:hypothetical protein